MGPQTDFSGFFTGIGKGVERWGENRRNRQMWEDLINAPIQAEKQAQATIRKQGSLTDAEYNRMVEDFVNLDNKYKTGQPLSAEEQNQYAYYNQVGMSRDKIGERGVLQNLWGAVAGDKEVGRLGSLKSLVGMGAEPETAVMTNAEMVNYFQKLKDLENYQQTGQMTPEMKQKYSTVLAQKKKESIIPALGKISPEAALRESGYRVDKPSSTVGDEKYKKNRNRLENDRVVLGRLTDAMNTAYNTYKDSVGTTEEEKRLAEYNDSKTRVDEARQRFMDTYSIMYPSDAMPGTGGGTGGGSDTSKNGGGTGTKSDPEQRTALANLKNTGFSKVANPDELANLLTSKGIVNPTLVDDAKKSWALTPEGKAYSASIGQKAEAKAQTKKENDEIATLFATGEFAKLLAGTNDVISSVNKVADIYARVSAGNIDQSTLSQMVGDVQRAIARSREEGKLTDDDIKQASGVTDVTSWLNELTRGFAGDPKRDKEKLLSNAKYAYETLQGTVNKLKTDMNNRVSSYNDKTQYVDITEKQLRYTPINKLSKSTGTPTKTSGNPFLQ